MGSINWQQSSIYVLTSYYMNNGCKRIPEWWLPSNEIQGSSLELIQVCAHQAMRCDYAYGSVCKIGINMHVSRHDRVREAKWLSSGKRNVKINIGGANFKDPWGKCAFVARDSALAFLGCRYQGLWNVTCFDVE